MSAEGYLIRHERELDRSIELESTVRQELRDALEHDSIPRRNFIGWVCDDSERFITAMLNSRETLEMKRDGSKPGELSRSEHIERFKSDYVDAMFELHCGVYGVMREFHIGEGA